MSEDSSTIQPESYNAQTFSEAQVNKFKNLAYEYFQKERTGEHDYLRCIRENARLYSFNLPAYLTDVLILFEEAPYFWLTDSPFVISLEDFFKRQNSKLYDIESIKTIKAYYAKWAIQRDFETKSYFGKSAITLLEKNPQKNNFLYLLYLGAIYTFDPKSGNIPKALELYAKAKEIAEANNLKPELKDDSNYLISVYTGFAYLKGGDLAKAFEVFTEALNCKATGISAQYYLAYLDMKQGLEESARKHLEEIFLSDSSKVQYAISINNINLLSYFLVNAASVHFFEERTFLPLSTFFQGMFGEAKKTSPEFIDSLNTKLHILHELHYEDYYDKEINEVIPFIGKIYQTYKGSKNVFLLANADKLLAKFDKIYEIIYTAISKKLYSQLKEALKPYDNQINDNLDKIKAIEGEIEIVKKATTEEYEYEIQLIEDKSAELIKETERETTNVNTNKKYDPQTSFTNSMFYNLIVSFSVFVIAGLATYSNYPSGDGNDYRNFLSALMIGGAKWGTITFLLGVIMSMITATVVFAEKSSYKSRLLTRLNNLKLRREKDLEILRQNHEMRLKMIDQNFNNRIESAKLTNDGIIAEREIEEQKLKEKIDAVLLEEAQKLNRLI